MRNVLFCCCVLENARNENNNLTSSTGVRRVHAFDRAAGACIRFVRNDIWAIVTNYKVRYGLDRGRTAVQTVRCIMFCGGETYVIVSRRIRLTRGSVGKWPQQQWSGMEAPAGAGASPKGTFTPGPLDSRPWMRRPAHKTLLPPPLPADGPSVSRWPWTT